MDARGTAQLVAQADVLVELGRLEQALALVGPVLAAEPEHLGAGLTAAVCQANLGRHDEAMALLKRLAPAHPEAADPMRLMSFIAVRQGDRATSLECAERAVALAPWSVDTHIQLAEALALRGARIDAIGAARRAIELAPHSAAAHLALSDALFPEGTKPPAVDLDEAEAHVRQALAIQPAHAAAHNELGRIAMARGSLIPAAKFLAMAVTADLRQDVALRNLSLVFGGIVWRAHLVVYGLWLVSGVFVRGQANRSLLVMLNAVVVAVVVWTWVRLRSAVPRHMSGFVRGFARRDPLGSLWGAFLALGVVALAALPITDPSIARVFRDVAGACLGAGAVTSMVRSFRFKAS